VTAITDKTKGNIPVHLFGHPVDMTTHGDRSVSPVGSHRRLRPVHWCGMDGSKVGSIGHGCFGFYPPRIWEPVVMVGCNYQRPRDRGKMQRLREHGEKTRYYHHEIGVNSRLDALQARFFRLSYAIWILGIISVG